MAKLTKEEKNQITRLTQAGNAEITALKSTLQDQGLSNKEINSIVGLEKSANKLEVKDAKKTLGADGIQYFAGDANAQIRSSASAYADNPNYLAAVTGLLDNASNLYNKFNIQQVNSSSGGVYTGVNLDQLTKAVINQNEDGTFNQGSGNTRVKNSVFSLLNDASQNYGQTFTEDELGKVKSAGKDAAGNEIFRTNLGNGSYESNTYSLLRKNEDGTYTNVGYTGITKPPQDDGGFFGSTLGKIALAAGAYFTGGALMPALSGLGTIGAGAATGGLLGAGTAALTGGNLLKGAGIGALTGGTISAVAPYVSSAYNDLVSGVTDGVTVAPSTTTPTMASQYGNLDLPTVGDLTAGTGSIGQGLNPNIITSAGQLNDLQALGLVSPQAAATAGNMLYSGAAVTPQAALNLGINPTVLQPTTMSGLSAKDVNTALDFGLSSSTTAPLGSGEFQSSVLDTARQVNDAQAALGDLYSGNTADKLLAQAEPFNPFSLGNLGLSGVLRGLGLANALFNRPQQPRMQGMQMPDGSIMPYGEVDYSGLFNLLGSQSGTLRKQQSLLG